jgi:hypothetical protein
MGLSLVADPVSITTCARSPVGSSECERTRELVVTDHSGELSSCALHPLLSLTGGSDRRRLGHREGRLLPTVRNKAVSAASAPGKGVDSPSRSGGDQDLDQAMQLLVGSGGHAAVGVECRR